MGYRSWGESNVSATHHEPPGSSRRYPSCLIPSATVVPEPHATTASVVKPNFFCRSLSGADAPKVCMPMTVPGGADVIGPAEGRGLFHRDPRRDLRRQHAVAILLRLIVEQFPRRHAHHARLDALRLELFVRFDAQRHFAAGRQQEHVRLAVRRVGQDIGALATPAAGAYLVRSSVGSACRVRMSAAGSWCSFMMTFQASATSLASRGPQHDQARDGPQRRQLLDRLVRRPVLADADRVVREDVNDRASPSWRQAAMAPAP